MKNLLLLLFLIPNLAMGEHPTTGLIFGEKEKKSLKYFCNKDYSTNILSCEFDTVSIRKKTNIQDAKIEKQRMMKLWGDEKDGFNGKYGFGKNAKEAKEGCLEATQYLSVLKGKIQDPNGFFKFSEFKKKPIKAQKDAILEIQLAKDFACNPSKRKFTKLLDFNMNKDLKTCNAGSQAFKQTFKQVKNSNVWVNNSGVKGTCGIVDISKFEKTKSKYGGFWHYTSEKKVTNKNDKSGVIPCSDFDEKPYLYSHHNREIHVGCEYIEWSVF